MPHYHRYGLKWGFAFLKIIIPGEVLAIQPTTYPDRSPSNEVHGLRRFA